jgi:hypothetical protein
MPLGGIGFGNGSSQTEMKRQRLRCPRTRHSRHLGLRLREPLPTRTGREAEPWGSVTRSVTSNTLIVGYSVLPGIWRQVLSPRPIFPFLLIRFRVDDWFAPIWGSYSCLVGEICGSPLRSNRGRKLGLRDSVAALYLGRVLVRVSRD